MMNATAQAEFLSVSELALRLRVSRTTAYQLVRERQVPSIRLGGSIRIPTSALDRWLSDQEHEALASVANRGLAAP